MSTKDIVLELFEKHRGFYISGQQIASELNITRTAVWKAVKILQKEGYKIEAVTNRGYCLDKDADVLSVRGIRSHLNEDCSGLRPEVFVSVGSTNTLCHEKAKSGEAEGYVAVAGAQTAGRGRRGRSFYSPAGTGIYMSLLLRPHGFTGDQVLGLTTMAAVAVSESVEALSDKKAEIKWVNDIFVDGKKVCGILSEAMYEVPSGALQCVIVGIGINAYAPEAGFPPEISATAGCVFDKPEVDLKNSLVAEVLNRFMKYYDDPKSDAVYDEYRTRSMVIDKDIKVLKKDATLKAHVLDIDRDCGLVVRYPDGTEEVLNSGEISIRV